MKMVDKTCFSYLTEFLDSTQYDAVWVKHLCILFIQLLQNMPVENMHNIQKYIHMFKNLKTQNWIWKLLNGYLRPCRT